MTATTKRRPEKIRTSLPTIRSQWGLVQDVPIWLQGQTGSSWSQQAVLSDHTVHCQRSASDSLRPFDNGLPMALAMRRAPGSWRPECQTLGSETIETIIINQHCHSAFMTQTEKAYHSVLLPLWRCRHSGSAYSRLKETWDHCHWIKVRPYCGASLETAKKPCQKSASSPSSPDRGLCAFPVLALITPQDSTVWPNRTFIAVERVYSIKFTIASQAPCGCRALEM